MMKRRKKENFKKYWNKSVLWIGVLVLLVVSLFLTFGPEKCENFECFSTHMSACTPAKFVNEEPEASWGYEIRGQTSNKQCQIEVTLLGAKEGDLRLVQYEGNSMNCFYDIGVVAYPEKDLDNCHGLLKENLQELIIEKLYRYVIDNLGVIGNELRGV